MEVPAADLAEGGGCPFENLFDLTQWLPHHEWLLEVAERRRNQPAAGQQGGTADDDDGGDGDDNDDTGEDGEREDEDIEEEAGEDDNPGAEAQVTDRDGPVDLVRWPLRKEGTVTQVVWHESVDGHIAVAGGYSWPNDSVWPKHRRGTTPALGGTDTLQPQSAGLLAALLRGELGSPRVVCMEACTMAKAGGKLVQEAMLHAPRVLVLELCVSRAEAVARIRSRDGPWSGKKRMTPEEKYDTYAREVTELHERMDARACVLDVKVEWMRGSASELRGVCRELLASGVLG